MEKFLIWVNVICMFIPSTYGAPQSFDCPMRQLALQFAQEIQPFLVGDQLQEIADALNGSPESQNCNISSKSLSYNTQYRQSPVWDNVTDFDTLFVDYNKGDDNNDGSIINPLKMVETAIYRSRGFNDKKSIMLREGRHYLSNTIYFTPDDNNLLITNYNGENVEISGAFPIECDWKLYKSSDYYQCDLSKNKNIKTLTDNNFGLRVNSMRGVRARYPNANPELDGFGSTLLAVSWFPSIIPTKPKYQFNPLEPFRNTTSDTCFQHYLLGVDDICQNYYPPAGYFCSPDIQGGGYGNSQCNQGALPYAITSGFVYNSSILPHTPYQDPSDAIIHVWRPGHWATWQFTVADYKPNNNSNVNGSFTFDKGGFQGGRGDYRGDEFYIENVFEELDNPNEWYFNDKTNILYYRNNVTENNNIHNVLFEITNLTVLMNFTGNGMNNPIKNIEIRGITFKDTRYTFFYPHGLPSGGDWSLARIGAIYLDNGNEDFMIQQNLFTRLDGNTISINQYARNITMYRNEVVWNGDNVVSAWGYTRYPNNTNQSTPLPDEWGMGWDGTGGNQPRGINLIQNFVHEIGIWEKQSSMWFQAKSCSNWIYGNIVFNGPRAGINFNDGFGGNTTMKKNLLFNQCRESGDHGPFNSWDRQVYVTAVATGTPSVIKDYDYHIQNFMIANYNSVNAIDNDDGSCYYKALNNFMVYAPWGLKSDYSGHDTVHYNNIYGYVSQLCFNSYSYTTDNQIAGHVDAFYNNTCVIDIESNPQTYGNLDCSAKQNTWPRLGNNTIYINNNNQDSNNVTGLCNLNEVAFQKTYNLDIGTVIFQSPNDTDIIQQAKEMLWA